MTEGSGCQGHRISQTMTGHVTVHQSWVRAGQSEYQSIATSYINNLKYTRSKGLHVDVLITLYGIISLYLNKSLPILNWANVCSPNILQTVRRTMIRFLIELLVRRTWFGQLDEPLRSQLACNEMQASARTCGRRAANSMIENVG